MLLRVQSDNSVGNVSSHTETVSYNPNLGNNLTSNSKMEDLNSCKRQRVLSIVITLQLRYLHYLSDWIKQETKAKLKN